jgi:hypothetical protein
MAARRDVLPFVGGDVMAWHMMKACLATMSALLLAGCVPSMQYQAYMGSRLPAEQEVILYSLIDGHEPAGPDPERIVFLCVDGQSTKPFMANFAVTNQVMVQPGVHDLLVQYSTGMLFHKGKFELNAEPGKSYLVRRAVNGYQVDLWIEDARTGVHVGSKEPLTEELIFSQYDKCK